MGLRRQMAHPLYQGPKGHLVALLVLSHVGSFIQTKTERVLHKLRVTEGRWVGNGITK